MKAKILFGTIIFSLFTSPVFGIDIFHEIENEQTITDGVIHLEKSLVTDIGWLDVNILKIDLSNPNVDIAPIDAGVLDTKQTILKMAKDSGAVAAINADFFSLTSTVPSFGAAINDGTVKQIYNTTLVEVGPNMDMANILIDKNLNIIIDYIDTTVSLHSEKGFSMDINAYNKIGTYLSRPVILDNQYTKNTANIIKKFPYTMGLLVEDDVVTAHVALETAVDIPDNGYVILMNSSLASEMFLNFPENSKIFVDIKTHLSSKRLPDINLRSLPIIENISFGIGGGGLILKDGKPYLGVSNIVGENSRHPRTLIATTNTPDELLLVTIDGRIYSQGAKHSEVIDILLNLGAKDAMYLDGGGSTTMVARDVGDFTPTTQNLPSDGAERKVMNGIGVFSTQKQGELTDFHVELDKTQTVIDGPIRFSVTGIDEFSNPIKLNNYNVDVIGIEADIAQNSITPKTAGDAFIVLEKDGIETDIEIEVFDKLIGIEIEPSLMNLDVGEKEDVVIIGTTNDGHQIEIDGIELSDTMRILDIKNGTVSSKSAGTTILKASYNGLNATSSVVVGSKTIPIESFENNLPKWGGDTTQIKGKVEHTKSVVFQGNRAVKMSYTFKPSKNKQVAYAEFVSPIMLPNDAISVNLWVKGDDNTDTLKIEVVDQKDDVYHLKLADTLKFNDYRYLDANLPEDIKLPAQITKIYAYANKVDATTTSTIYFDNLSIIRGNNIQEGFGGETDHSFDNLYNEVNAPPKNGEYHINIMGQTLTNSFVLGDYLKQVLANALTAYDAKVILASKENIYFNFDDALGINTGFWELEYKDVELINLDTQNGGIIETDVMGWAYIIEALENTPKKHIIILTTHHPLNYFSNKKEGEAFHNYLASFNKNIFVITTSGDKNEVQIKDNVRYINTIGLNIDEDNFSKASFLQFKVEGNNISYAFKNIRP
ncbi:hypothetical protein AN641_02035 [Candidatus Epulonipiscioides gigas]|nr:hypothetical protein AN641_02035 [Epulopiscium sp. SCG-C07WGA-EpuloA2]